MSQPEITRDNSRASLPLAFTSGQETESSACYSSSIREEMSSHCESQLPGRSFLQLGEASDSGYLVIPSSMKIRKMQITWLKHWAPSRAFIPFPRIGPIQNAQDHWWIPPLFSACLLNEEQVIFQYNLYLMMPSDQCFLS